MPQLVVIYGAAARLPGVAIGPGALKARLRGWRAARRDLARARRGDLTALDYRDYDRADAVNIGDHAISEAVIACLGAVGSSAPIRRLNWGELDTLERQAPGRRPPTVIVAGGGYLQFDRQHRLARRVVEDLRQFERTGVRPIFFGIGINGPELRPGTDEPFDLHEPDARLLRDLFGRARLVGVRDWHTYRVLAQLTDAAPQLVGDPALHLASLRPVEAVPPARAGGAPIVGLNLSFHGPIPNALLQRNLDQYVQVLQELQRRFNCGFRYFRHYPSETILPRLFAARGLVVTPVRARLPELLARYRQLDLHIGGMLHSCILAHSVDTPGLGLAYDIKHQGFFELLELGEHCLSTLGFDPDALLDRATAILDDPDTVRPAIRSRRLALRASTLEFAAACRAPIPATVA